MSGGWKQLAILHITAGSTGFEQLRSCRWTWYSQYCRIRHGKRPDIGGSLRLALAHVCSTYSQHTINIITNQCLTEDICLWSSLMFDVSFVFFRPPLRLQEARCSPVFWGLHQDTRASWPMFWQCIDLPVFPREKSFFYWIQWFSHFIPPLWQSFMLFFACCSCCFRDFQWFRWFICKSDHRWPSMTDDPRLALFSICSWRQRVTVWPTVWLLSHVVSCIHMFSLSQFDRSQLMSTHVDSCRLRWVWSPQELPKLCRAFWSLCCPICCTASAHQGVVGVVWCHEEIVIECQVHTHTRIIYIYMYI